MTNKTSGFRYIPGSTDILVVAPHGPVIDGAYQNDIRTGVVAEQIQLKLGCCAVINDLFFKPTPTIPKCYDDYLLDLFRIDHSTRVPGYLDRIKEIADSNGRTLIVWVHGIADKMAVTHGRVHIDNGLFDGEPTQIEALIGYGQGGDPKTGQPHDRFTARRETVESFRDQLTAGGMTTLLTYSKGSNYRGRDSKRLNQWFSTLGYGFGQVESIQLEIKEQGLRDSDDNAARTGRIIARALSAMAGRK